MAESEQQAVAVCRRCRGGQETSTYLGNSYEYDVDHARRLTGDGREPVEVEEESVRESVLECTIDEHHIDHVDPTIPGLIAPIRATTEDGAQGTAHVLID